MTSERISADLDDGAATPEDDLLEAADYLARARRAGAQEPGGTLTELYMWVFALVLLAAMTTSGWSGQLAAHACTGMACGHGAGLLAALAVGLLLVGGLLRAALALGPVGADMPHLTWLLSGPGPRRPVLRRRLWLMAAGGAFLGLLLGPTVLTTAGLPILPDALWPGLAVGATAGLLAVAVAALGQSGGLRGGLAQAPRALMLLGVLCGAAAWLLPTSAPPAWQALSAGPAWAWTAALLPLVVLGVALLLRADRRIDRIDGHELRRAGDTASSAHQSALMLDASVVTRLGERDRLGARGTRRSRRGHGRGPLALLARDLERVRRQGDRLLLAIPLLVGVGLLGTLAPPLLTLPAAGLAAAWLARATGEGLTWWSRSTGLRRSLPWPDEVVRGVLLVAPALVVAAWGAALVLVLGISGWVVPALVASSLASLLSGARPPNLEHMSLMVPTAFGMMPMGAMTAGRGYELPLLAMLGPVLVPGPQMVLLPLVVLVWQWGRAGRA